MGVVWTGSSWPRSALGRLALVRRFRRPERRNRPGGGRELGGEDVGRGVESLRVECVGDFVGSVAGVRAAARLRQEPFSARDFMRRNACACEDARRGRQGAAVLR